jgi:SAM-dependent methyltransferase
MTEWFKQWFGEEYHALYPHRDEEDARRAVALIRDAVKLEPGARILDLACGPGRHAAELTRSGGRVVGLDLSRAMLRRARERAPGALVRGDMRALPFRDASFALAVNLFTSFGYFLDDGENRVVLKQVVHALERRGAFVLDYLNADYVRRNLALGERTVGPGVRVTRRLEGDGRFVIKEIELHEEGRRFVERVRLYSAAELRALLTDAGLRVSACYGDYDGGPIGTEAPRVILVGVRE